MKIDKEELKNLGYNLIPVSEIKIEKVEDFNDEYVYDLEVDDGSHTFFANDILVHNSIYVRMDNILKLSLLHQFQYPNIQKLQLYFLLAFHKNPIQLYIQFHILFY